MLWVVAFTFVPLIFVIRYSFANYVLGMGITGYVGFQNYADVLASDRFWHSIMVTAAYVALSVPIELVLGFVAAWLVNLGAPWSHGFRTIIGTPLFTMPRASMIRGFVLNHLIHHRAILCVYLRLNDVPVPGMYGPSGDEFSGW